MIKITKTIFLEDIIVQSANAGIKMQRPDGSMPAGHNGPWNDPDTSVRNTAHWAITFYKAYKISEKDIFLKAAISACNYLLTPKARPNKGAFLCRTSKKKNKENGLIGQVWALEPLVFLGNALKCKEYLELSRHILLQHKYEEEIHLWRNLNIDGRPGFINGTFNQQVWFGSLALINSYYTGDKTLKSRATDFFWHISTNVSWLERGLIGQGISQYVLRKRSLRSKIKRCIKGGPNYVMQWGPNYVMQGIRSKLSKQQRSIGYLPFTSYGFALAHATSKNENWWREEKVRQILIDTLKYIQTKRFYDESFKTKYGWSYNPIGFEIAYSLYVFQDLLEVNGNIDTIRPWVELQLKKHWNPKSGLMNNDTSDPLTLSARLYELTRLPNMKIDFSLKFLGGQNPK